MKLAKKILCLMIVALTIIGLTGNLNVNAKDASATSITFKTTTGGDFVAGVSKMKITFKLNAAAKNVKLSIINSSDDVVYTKNFKTCKKGKTYSLSWNGKNKKNKYVGEDFYYVSITAGKTVTKSDELNMFKFIRKSGFAGGDGSEKKPYEVATVDQLKKVLEHNGQYFRQTENIDMDYEEFSALFSSDYPFSGSYDGDGFEISNGLISRALFAAVGKDGEVKDVVLNGCNISGHEAAGITITNDGALKNCVVKNCNFSEGGNTNDGGMLAGLAVNNNGKIIGCNAENINTSDATGNDRCAGICSKNTGNVLQCTVSDSSFSTTNPYRGAKAGGIAGDNYGTISNCNVKGNISFSGYEPDWNGMGAIAGWNGGVISSCTSTLEINMVGSGSNAT